MIRDSAFTCNTRQLFNAYPSISYMLRYSFFKKALATHATDLIPTFINDESDAKNILIANNVSSLRADLYAFVINSGVKSWYQDYLSSFGVYGNPNKGKKWDAQTWPLATQGKEEVSNVLEVYSYDSSRLISDDQNTQSTCLFWNKMAGLIENISKNEQSGNKYWAQTQLEL